MFGFLGKLFGTDKAAESVINNVSKGIDKLWYTDEEKSEDKAKAVREGNAVYMEWLRSTSGSRIARRFIAVIITVVWALQYTVALVLSAITPWISSVETVLAIKETIVALQTNGAQMDAAMMLVLTYYFLGNKGDQLIEAAINKFKNNKNKEN